MVHRQEGLPSASLFVLTAALFLFGIGGGLVGYMIGERDGEQRANAIVQVLGERWDEYREQAKTQFKQATAVTATRLEKAVADIRSEVSMYHGCGAICTVIAYQFGEEVLHARDDIAKGELTTLMDWREGVRQSGVPLAPEAIADATSGTSIEPAYSSTTLVIAITLLSTTVALCFGIAAFTILKLRLANTNSA